MPDKRIFLDSNVIIYAYSDDEMPWNASDRFRCR